MVQSDPGPLQHQGHEVSWDTTQIRETLMSTERNKCGVGGILQGSIAGSLTEASNIDRFDATHTPVH